ncbi:MAG: sugar transferase [Opitutae bacterium]|nr:sugar transferase [Opitutae bacterium]
MLAQTRQIRVRLLQVADGTLFAVALTLAYLARARFPWLDLPELETFDKYLWLLPTVGGLGPAMLASQGFYRPARIPSRLMVVLRVLRGATFLVLALILILFLTREQFARSVVIMVGALGALLVYSRHELVAWIEASRLAQAQSRRRVLWLGLPEENRRLQSVLTASEHSALETVADLSPRELSAEKLTELLHVHAINLVIVNLAGIESPLVSPLLAACEREGVELLLRPGLLTASPYRLEVDELGGEAVFFYRAQAAPASHLFIKRVLDYLLATVLLAALSPLYLAVALAVRLSSPGPILYRQPRAGLNGRAFTMYKFRSMRADAEQQQAALASQNEMRGPVFKVTHDPRVTPLGRILRRHSLDELPQLWNVLRGEMSLVGPRPLPLEEVRRFADDAHRRRLSVRPGLTCLWQISGRNDIADFEDWVRLDLAYIDQWSLWLDCKILCATIPVALLGRGGR